MDALENNRSGDGMSISLRHDDDGDEVGDDFDDEFDDDEDEYDSR